MPWTSMGPEKRDHKLAYAEEQFRAVLHSTDPQGETTSWVEGPYVKPHTATARITYWKNNYEKNPKRSGWKIDGHVEMCEMKWRSR